MCSFANDTPDPVMRLSTVNSENGDLQHALPSTGIFCSIDHWYVANQLSGMEEFLADTSRPFAHTRPRICIWELKVQTLSVFVAFRRRVSFQKSQL